MEGASKKKGRGGRPRTGVDPVYTFRIPKEIMDQADEWAKARGLTRSYAIRRWIENGVLERWKRPKGRKPS